MKGQLLLLLLFAVVFFCVMVIVLNEGEQNGLATTFFLKPPALVEAACACSEVPSMDVYTRIKGEAGISAYGRSSSNIDLSKLRERFTTIEAETDDYLLGSMSVPNYPECYDPHVYVHRNGWVLAYYFKTEPIGKIIDVKAQDISHTKLGNVVVQVLNWADAPPADVTYYHFAHPEATHMMFVAETYDEGDNQFQIQMPPTFIYHEQSWALGDSGGEKYFKINGVDQLTSTEISESDRIWNVNNGYGMIRDIDLPTNVMHSIAVDEYGVLVLLYWAHE